uniref:Thioredoxin domain-containing protein 17 n=1 Tax=Gopherus agassizii TaxID=38772 RepID=A0A452IB20_9SAUR
MGWEEKAVRGYSEFVQAAQQSRGRPVFALFCGDKDAQGRSWCPDCVTGESGGGTPPLRRAWAGPLLPFLYRAVSSSLSLSPPASLRRPSLLPQPR